MLLPPLSNLPAFGSFAVSSTTSFRDSIRRKQSQDCGQVWGRDIDVRFSPLFEVQSNHHSPSSIQKFSRITTPCDSLSNNALICR